MNASAEQCRTLADLVEKHGERYVVARMRGDLWVVFDELPGKIASIRPNGIFQMLTVADAS